MHAVTLHEHEAIIFICLLTVRDLNLETDKTYPSTRLLQNNTMYKV